MNYIKIEKITDLYQIFDVSIYLSGDESQEQKEIYNNCWGIIINDKFAKKIKVDEIADFISDLVKLRSVEILNIKPKPQAILYFWFDKMALQLCFNILSGANRKLPFGYKINLIDSPYPILKQFLKIVRDNAVYGNYHEFTFIEKGDPGFDDDYEVSFDDFVIDVWQITLPWDNKENKSDNI